MTTPNMGLDLPVVSTTPGPAWATAVNDAFEEVDAHDHSTGKGVKITPTGMNINANLEFNGNDAIELRSVRFEDQGTVQTEATDLGCLQLVGGDLWWVNGNGTGVQITSGAGLSFASLGTIGGDFGQPGVTASVTYSDTTKIYSFLQDSGITAGIYGSKLLLADDTSGALSVTLTADAATGAYTLVLPVSAPTDDTVLTFNAAGTGSFRAISGTTGEITVTPSAGAHTVSLPATITKSLAFTGTTSFAGGPGVLPLGAVVATFPSLTGAYACAATTAADANGFVQCAGQTLVDVTSPMNGAVIPNINNNAFLRGNATSGSTGGASSVTLTANELPSHTHTLNNATVSSSSHTHTIAHIHQITRTEAIDGIFAMLNTTTAMSTLSFNSATSGAGRIADFSNTYGTGSAGALFGVGGTNGFSAGARDAAGSAAVSGTPSATATLSANSTGSGSSFSILPNYITARYIMRVK
jgi:hypothetical protein